MIVSATGNDRLDDLCTQGVAGRFAVVPAIFVEDIRVTTRPASPANDSQETGDCRQDQSLIAGIGQRGVDDERDAVTAHDEPVPHTRLPAVSRTWTRTSPPPNARTRTRVADNI